MGWSKGRLFSFGGFAARSMAAYFNTLSDTDFSSIVTSGGGVVAQASGGTGVAMRWTKSAAAGKGSRRLAAPVATPDSAHMSISMHIHFRSSAGASGIAASSLIRFYSWVTTADTLGELGIKNVGSDDGGSRDLRLFIGGALGTIAWQSAYTMVVDTDYQIQFRIYTPKPGLANENWRHQVVLRANDGTELDRSPIAQVNQNGVTVQDAAGTIAPGFGIWGDIYSTTTNAPDYVVNAYCFVTNGAWSPDVVKCGMNGAASNSGTAARNEFVLVAGADKPTAVDPSADLDDTTYINTTTSAGTEDQQYFTHAGSNITLGGGEEVFAVRALALVKIVSGGGILQPGMFIASTVQTDLNGTGNSASYAWTYTRPAVRNTAAVSAYANGGDTGSPWDVTGVDAVEFGVGRLLGAGSGQDKRCTAALMEILYGEPASDNFGGNHTTREENHTTSTRRTMPAGRTP